MMTLACTATYLAPTREIREVHLRMFIPQIVIKFGILPRTVSLLLIAMMPAIAHAQSPPLHIRIINAQTNKPIPNERLNVALRTDQIGSVPMATDKNGIILVN